VYCVHVSVCACIYVCMHACITCACVHFGLVALTLTSVGWQRKVAEGKFHLCVCVYCVHVSIVCMHVCMYACMHVCMYVCIYV
jgi:hypothetical protein